MKTTKYPRINNIPSDTGIGIYAITDENGKSYIGSSCDTRRRIIQHCNALQKGTENRKFQNAYDNGAVFSVSILRHGYDGMSKKELYAMEKEEIRRAGGLDNTYNSAYNQTAYIDSYVYGQDNQIELLVPTELCKSIQSHAEGMGESVQAFIIRAITETIECDKYHNYIINNSNDIKDLLKE